MGLRVCGECCAYSFLFTWSCLVVRVKLLCICFLVHMGLAVCGGCCCIPVFFVVQVYACGCMHVDAGELAHEFECVKLLGCLSSSTDGKGSHPVIEVCETDRSDKCDHVPCCICMQSRRSNSSRVECVPRFYLILCRVECLII